MDVQNLNRRAFMRRAGVGVVTGFSVAAAARALADDPPVAAPPPLRSTPGGIRPRVEPLPPIRATRDRLIKENVGLRPFREGGPNLSVETVGAKTVVHNYGHGGSGWSLSWGTGLEAREKALATGASAYAVIGCGAVGLTSAILLQQAGQSVTIYAKARNPNITSTMATGVWSPDSRICLEEHATPAFGAWWEKTARASFKQYQHLLGLPGYPVEWVDRYAVSNRTHEEIMAERAALPGPHFAHFRDRVEDLTPRSFDLEPGEHPFAERYVNKSTGLVFNLPAYMDYLQRQFTSVGGRIVMREFHQPSDFASLPEETIVNCTGLGSKTLFGDRQMVPVWGQMSFLVPQPEVRYSFSNEHAYAIARRDGIALSWNENGRYGETEAIPDREQSYRAIDAIAQSMAAMRFTA